MRENSTKGTVAANPTQRKQRRNRLIALVSCLAVVMSLVFIIQNPALISRRSPGFVGQVAFSPDGKRLAWTSEGQGEGRVIVWDLEHRRQRLLIGPRDSEPDRVAVSTYTSLAFSPDGHTHRNRHQIDPRSRSASDSLGFSKRGAAN